MEDALELRKRLLKTRMRELELAKSKMVTAKADFIRQVNRCAVMHDTIRKLEKKAGKESEDRFKNERASIEKLNVFEGVCYGKDE